MSRYYNTRSAPRARPTGGRALTHGALDTLATIHRPARDAGTLAKIEAEAVASYSWIESPTGSKPTIAVPGSPPIWTREPSRVPQDRGLVWIDQNSGRLPTDSPLTPIFAAIDTLHKTYAYSEVDLISDRNNLRKLFRWVGGSTDEFRIDIEHYGRKSVLFTRWEPKDSEIVTEFRGFGHEYEKAATKEIKGCEGATGHHRIISIDLGGVKTLLRFEVDACTGASSVDDLANALSALSTTSKPSAAAEKPTIPPHPVLIVKPTAATKPVPQSTLIELKTRVSHKELDYAEVYPQLYLSQTPYLYLAKHTKGTFNTVEKIPLTSEKMLRHAKSAEDNIGKLQQALAAILAAVRKAGPSVPLCLVCKGGALTLHKRDPKGQTRVISKADADKFEL